MDCGKFLKTLVDSQKELCQRLNKIKLSAKDVAQWQRKESDRERQRSHIKLLRCLCSLYTTIMLHCFKPMGILVIQNCSSIPELNFCTIYILDFAFLTFLYNIVLLKTLLIWLCNFLLNVSLLFYAIFFFNYILQIIL